MTITNKHIGWGIVILLLASPWIIGYGFIPDFDCFLMFGGSDSFNIPALFTSAEIVIVGGMGGLGILIASVAHIGMMIDGTTKFSFHIPALKRKPPADTREDFLKLGTLDQNTPEWKAIYERLDKKGQWG